MADSDPVLWNKYRIRLESRAELLMAAQLSTRTSSSFSLSHTHSAPPPLLSRARAQTHTHTHVAVLLLLSLTHTQMSIQSRASHNPLRHTKTRGCDQSQTASLLTRAFSPLPHCVMPTDIQACGRAAKRVVMTTHPQSLFVALHHTHRQAHTHKVSTVSPLSRFQ